MRRRGSHLAADRRWSADAEGPRYMSFSRRRAALLGGNLSESCATFASNEIARMGEGAGESFFDTSVLVAAFYVHLLGLQSDGGDDGRAISCWTHGQGPRAFAEVLSRRGRN